MHVILAKVANVFPVLLEATCRQGADRWSAETQLLKASISYES